MDLTYVHTLLLEGFKVPESTDITIVKRVGCVELETAWRLAPGYATLQPHATINQLQVQYKDEQIEAAWPLGAAINTLN